MPEPATDTPSKKSSVPPVRSPSAQNKGAAPGGGITEEIEVVFLESLDKKYECPVCGQVLRYPVQFEECGHRCCSSCLPDLLRVAPRCPLDQVSIDKDKVYVDKAFQKETDNLGVKCCFFGRGCTWSGILKELMAHLEGCDRMMTTCPMNCGVEFEKRFLQKHKSEDCPKRSIHCQFCEVELMAEDEAEHLEECGKFPVPCPNNCSKKEVIREKLQEHLEQDCMKQDIICPFGPFGCEFSGVKNQIEDHTKAEYQKHLIMMCDSVKKTNKNKDLLEKALKEQEYKLLGMEKRVMSLEKLYGPQLIWKIDDYQNKLSEAKSGKKATIFSPPFLTNRHGYKLALSACLYGDGKCRGKHMSVFVCICKGDTDALLNWPFAYRIVFTLIDQCEDPVARRNITYIVKPNTCKENKPFLGRPVGERNASFGAARFVELDVLNTLDYIKDDTIFIKVNVDCEDMVAL